MFNTWYSETFGHLDTSSNWFCDGAKHVYNVAKKGVEIGASVIGGVVSATVEDVGTAVFSVPDLINSGCNFIPGVNLYTNYANDFSNWYHEGEEDIIGDNDVFYTTKAVVNAVDAVVEGVEIMTVGTVETIIGGGGEVLGVALDSTGALAPAGIPINVASGSLIAAGVTTIAYGVEKTKNNIANFEHNVEKAKESYDKPDDIIKTSDEVIEGGGGNAFKSQDLLDSHYAKHADEFGNITKEQYLKGAQDLVNSNSGDGIMIKTRTNGDTLFYNTATNEFAIKASNGTIRTYFKPTDGINYFNSQ